MAADGSVVIEILGDAKDITSKLTGIAGGAVKTLTTAIAGVGTALSGISAAAIKVGAGFEQSMSQVAATMGLSVEEIQNGSAEFELLSQAAKDAGATTAFSASEAASALNYLALAGYDAATSAEVLPSVLNLAAAGGMDLAYAPDLATDAMAALGIEASKANLEQFGDQLAAAASNANASVSQLGEAILVVGGTAKSLAGGTTELNAALGVLANRGIKGAEGGTALRNIILSLSAPTDKAAKLMEELGLAVYDAEGKMRPLNETFKDLDAAMQGMTEGEKTNVLNDIFNKVDLKSAQALLAGTGEEFDTLAAAINNSAGAMENMAETQLDNLAGDMTKFKSASEAAGIALSSSLIPSLREVVQAGTGVMSFVGNAIEKVPSLGSVFAGVATGAATLTAGMGAMAAASAITGGAVTTLTGAVAALGGAIVASPIAPFALAVGGLVGIFTAVKAATNDATDANKEFLASLEETKEALSENAEEAKITGENLQAQAESILKLAEAEKLTGVEQKALLNMIQELNAAVPGLNLAYDEQTGKLNMTTEAVRNLIAAESDRLVQNEGAQAYSQLLAQQSEIALQLEQAEVELAEARAANAAAQTEEIVNGQKVIKLNSDLASAQSEAAMKVGELRQQYDSLQTAMDEIIAEYGDVVTSTEQAEISTNEVSDTAEDATAAFDELNDVTTSLVGSVDLLATALSDQEKEGSISLDTTNKLIEAGYAAALSIDEETGAVTLNRAEYERIASAKIQAQIATLEVQKSSLESVGSLSKEQAAVKADSSAYWDMARAKVAAANADNIKAIELQIAALNRAQSSLGSYSIATETAAKSSASASKKIKTQAEKDLEEFKVLKAEMDHQRNIDAISEEEYYQKLVEYRDRYLSDESNISNYRSITEQIYKYDKNLAQNEQKLWAEQTETWADELEDRLKEVQNQQEKVRDSLSNYGDLFTIEDDVMSLESLQSQIDAIEAYGDAIQGLRERGISESLLDQVMGMDEEKATQYANKLLAMSEDQYDNYLALWDEKQAAAARVSSEIYKDELTSLQTEFLDKIPEAAEQLPEELKPIGADAVRALTDGIEETKAEAVAMAAGTVDEILEQFKRLDNLSSMFTSAVEAASANMSASLTVAANAPAEARAARDRTNAYQTAAANAAVNGDSLNNATFIYRMDSTDFYRGSLKNLRTVEAETPETLDDK